MEAVLSSENMGIFPELSLGLAFGIASKYGINLMEALTLKCLINEQHYPTAWKGDKDSQKILKQVFRRGIGSPDDTQIPAMGVLFHNPLEYLHSSPYLNGEQLDFVYYATNGLMPRHISEVGAIEKYNGNYKAVDKSTKKTIIF
jgi:hypothetical protein